MQKVQVALPTWIWEETAEEGPWLVAAVLWLTLVPWLVAVWLLVAV